MNYIVASEDKCRKELNSDHIFHKSVRLCIVLLHFFQPGICRSLIAIGMHCLLHEATLDEFSVLMTVLLCAVLTLGQKLCFLHLRLILN